MADFGIEMDPFTLEQESGGVADGVAVLAPNPLWDPTAVSTDGLVASAWLDGQAPTDGLTEIAPLMSSDGAPSYSDGVLCMCPGCMGLIDNGADQPVDFIPTRGGTTTYTLSNGRVVPSFDTTQAGAYITRDNSRWSGSTADGNGGLTQFGQPATVTYAFAATARNANGTSGFSQFTAQQIAVAEMGLMAWSDVANISFVRVGSGTTGPGAFSDSATILFQNYSSGAEGAAAFAYFPGTRGFGSNSGDVYVNFSLAYNANPTLLNYGFLTMTHEIGHAIGLNHPGNYNAGTGGTISYEESANYREDTLQFSVMSYWAANRTGANHGIEPGFIGYPSAPLLDDISAAQRLYGANMTTRTGNDTYGFNNTTGRAWYGAVAGQHAPIFAVWDAGGIDTFDFSGYSQNQEIDLRETAFSSVGGLTYNVAIALGAVIENAIGGTGNDLLIGNAAINGLVGNAGNDTLLGGDGNDVLDGGDGADVLDGGAGTDTVSYNSATSGVTVVLAEGANNTGGAGFDTYISIEHIVGSAFADTLIGNAGANYIRGGLGGDRIEGREGDDVLDGQDGDDLLLGGVGNDTLAGGAGNDTISYAGVTSGVTVVLFEGANNTGGSGFDTYLGVENIIGSDFADNLLGDAAANYIRGGLGGDRIEGREGDDVLDGQEGDDLLLGGVGNDTLAGGAGTDTASYQGAASGVTVVLAEGANNTGGAGFDTYLSIEHLIGSSFADNLIGDAGANYIRGGAGGDRLEGREGDDVLDGQEGDDLLIGGAGADTLAGGAGVDTVTYETTGAGVTVVLFEGANNTGGAGFDTYIGVENLIGSGFGDHLLGDAAANYFRGGAGGDRLEGREGADVLDGGQGDDLLFGDAGGDGLFGDVGADRFIYRALTDSTGGPNTDRIYDFSSGDFFDVSAIDANTVAGGDQAFTLVGGFSGQAGQAIFQYNAASDTTFFAGDVNGDGVADFVVAFTGNVTSLSAGLVL